MALPFTLLVAAESVAEADELVGGKDHIVICEGRSALHLANKYFSGTVPCRAVAYPPWPTASDAYGIVFLLRPDSHTALRDLLTAHGEALADVEVKFLLSEEHSAEVAALAQDYECEYEVQAFHTDHSLRSQHDRDTTGLARVIEAVEVACASVLPQPPAPSADSEDFADIDAFEELIAKVRAASEASSSLSDDDRRRQAERVILEVVQRLGLES